MIIELLDFTFISCRPLLLVTPELMPYRPSGLDRDSYITGVRTGNGRSAIHDVNARRDNLPDNVFRYLKEQVDKERFDSFAAEERRGKNQIGASKGRRIVPPRDGMSVVEAERLTVQEEVDRKHYELKALYEHERRQWEKELAERGIALEKAM
jgi:hypothetical protein